MTSTRESEFFRAVASRKIPRLRVAAIVVRDGCLLVQRPTDDARSCYALIGGEYEIGDTFESRIRRELEEETTARVISSRYLFVVENVFEHDGARVHNLEHYVEVELDSADIESREPHLSQHWLPIATLGEVDLRPTVVRDAICSGAYLHVRHLSTSSTELATLERRAPA